MLRLRLVGASEIDLGNETIGPERTITFTTLLYLGMAGTRGAPRGELAALLWPHDARERQAHNLRSLIFRLRQSGAELEATNGSITLGGELTIDAREFGAPPSSISQVRALCPAIGPVLPAIAVPENPALARWLEDQRDRIVADLSRWLNAALALAKREGDWPLVEQLARAYREVDGTNEAAWLSLAEAQCLTASKERGLRTIDEYLALVDETDENLRIPALLLRRRVEGRVAEAAGDDPTTLFVGRADVLRSIHAAITRATERCGSALLLWGSAGIGKTEVLREVERSAAALQARAVGVSAHPSDALRPLSLVIDLAARLLDEPGAAGCSPRAYTMLRQLVCPAGDADGPLTGLAPEAAREAVLAAFVELLAALAEETPLVLQLDDVQWIDPAMWAFWRSVFRWSTNRRIVWLLAQRADAEAELAQLPPTPLVRRQELRSLDRASAELLVDGLIERAGAAAPARRRWILESAGGHPFLLRGLVQHVLGGSESGLAASVQMLVDEQLSRISRSALRALQTVSLLGAYASAERTERLSLLERRELLLGIEELERAGILVEEKRTLRAHALWSDAALARLEPSVRRLLHAHAAEDLEAESAQHPSFAVLWESARHWREADRPERAHASLCAGAEHLARHGFVAEAAAVLERIIAECVDPAERATLLHRRGMLLYEAGDLTGCITVADAHDAQLMSIDPLYNRHTRLEALRRWAKVYTTGNLSEAIAENSVCIADEDAPTEHRLLCASMTPFIAWPMRRWDAMEQAWRVMNTLPRRTAEDERLFLCMATIYETVLGDPREGLRIGHRLLASTSPADAPDSLHRVYSAVLDAAEHVGDLATAKRVIREMRHNAVTRLGRHRSILAHNFEVAFAIDTEDLATASAVLERVRDTPVDEEAVLIKNVFRYYTAEIAARRGDADLALRELDTPVERILEMPAPRWRARLLAIHLAAALLREDVGAIDALASHIRPLLMERDSWLDWPATVYARALERLHGPGAAREFAFYFVDSVRQELYRPRTGIDRFLPGVDLRTIGRLARLEAADSLTAVNGERDAGTLAARYVNLPSPSPSAPASSAT